jgi:arylsulfatase A
MSRIAGAFAAAALAVVAQTAAAAPGVNFVILFVDDMGIDQIEVPETQRQYGYTGNNHTIKTPHVSQLAAEGLVFQNWYSGYHICSPSRAAMMTGRLPIRSGCVPAVFFADAVGGLPANETTMAEALDSAGYRTMAIGKWRTCACMIAAAGPPPAPFVSQDTTLLAERIACVLFMQI